MANNQTWITIIVFAFLIIVIIGILIWLVLIQVNLSQVNTTGTQWSIVYGSSNQASDNVPGVGGTLFIARSTQANYLLNIQANSNSRAGQNLWINNSTIGTITVNAGSGVSITSNNLGSTINPGATAEYVFTDNNILLRLV